MLDLYKKYGYCIIPKGTVLFRGYNENEYKDYMFFATKQRVAEAFDSNIQVWETTTEFKVLFLIDFVDKRGWAYSSIVDLYKYIITDNKNTDINDLDIKKDKNKLIPLLKKLKDNYKIDGFLTSVENKAELEICTFNKEFNQGKLELLKNKKYKKDSLEKIRIFPSNTFYEKSEKKIGISSYEDKKIFFKEYENSINRKVDLMLKEYGGTDKQEEWYSFYNLRLNLKL